MKQEKKPYLCEFLSAHLAAIFPFGQNPSQRDNVTKLSDN